MPEINRPIENLSQSITLPPTDNFFRSLFDVTSIDDKYQKQKETEEINNLSKFLITQKDHLNKYFNKNLTPKAEFYHDFSNQYWNAYSPKLNPIPPAILSTISPGEQHLWSKVNSIDDRGQQQLLIDNSSKINQYFNKDGLFTSEFYSDYYSSKFCIDSYGELDYGEIVKERTNIPENILSTFSLEDQKFWSLVLNQGNTDFRDTLLKNKNNPEFLSKDMVPTSKLYEEVFKYYPIGISPDILSTFSSEDQKYWKLFNNIKCDDDFNVRSFLSQNKDKFSTFFDQDNQPTALFFESYVKEKINSFNYHEDPFRNNSFITNTLTPEIIQSFSPEVQKFWTVFKNIKGSDHLTVRKFIIQNKDQFNNFFNQNNQLTALFLESYTKTMTDQKNLYKGMSFGDDSFIINNLTPENIQSFSPEDQKFWNEFKNIKGYDSDKVRSFILQNKDQFNNFFNQNNQPTALFLASYIKNEGIKSIKNDSFIKEILTLELTKSFSFTDQKFWQLILDKNIKPEKDKKICSDDLAYFIINNKSTLVQNNSDIDFLNKLFGDFGNKAGDIIHNYQACLEQKIITNNDKGLVAEFLEKFKAISPIIISSYKSAKEAATDNIFISQLTDVAQRLTTTKIITDDERNLVYFLDLIKHTYPHNSGQWTTYENNLSCSDRSNDLALFKIKEKYEIDLLSQSQIKVKAGETLITNLQKDVEQPVLDVLTHLQSLDFDNKKGNSDLEKEINLQLEIITKNEGLKGIDLNKLKTSDERLFLLLVDSIYGTRSIDLKTIKNLLITYEFVNFEDIRNFIDSTNDKVSYAANKDYAHLCELNNFYSDRIKDVNKKIIENALKNPTIRQIMPEYFKKLNQETLVDEKRDSINKLQIDKLGLSKGFLEQITRTINQRSGGKKQYTADQIKEIVKRYENLTKGLTASKTNSPNKTTQAFYGQLRSQREKTLTAIYALGQNIIDPSKIHLGEINLQETFNSEKNIQTNNYNENQFLAYTAQKFINIFEEEKNKIENELDKFESSSGKQRETLNTYITKTKESANARMVGGVCVSGDNPAKNKETNQWDMPNYFQMVFQDPETLQCTGLNLLHHFDENGEKILTVSFNPSSTYLYSVDEEALFDGVMSQLEVFAKDNNFDKITVSQSKTIRTNRTGGVFERAIDKRISQINKTYKFSKVKQFSYSPNYQIQDMDVLWENS